MTCFQSKESTYPLQFKAMDVLLTVDLSRDHFLCACMNMICYYFVAIAAIDLSNMFLT
jgi:hypothetical protein